MNNLVASFVQNNLIFLFIFMAWSFVWKGIALWKAATLNSKSWFVLMLLINTIGILEIIYIFFLYKKNPDVVIAKAKNYLLHSFKKGKIK